MSTEGYNKDWNWKPITKKGTRVKRGFRRTGQMVFDDAADFMQKYADRSIKKVTITGIKTGQDGLVYGKVGKVTASGLKQSVKVTPYKVDGNPIQGCWRVA